MINENAEQAEKVSKHTTGISGFDEISEGGLPKGRAALLAGSTGCGKTIFSIQYLFKGITAFDENGVFVTFEETPEDIMHNVASFNWRLNSFIDQWKISHC